jgi:hypothetical protein
MWRRFLGAAGLLFLVTAGVAATEYALTGSNTSVTFIGTKPNGKHDGGFKTITGAATVPDNDLSARSRRQSMAKVEIASEGRHWGTFTAFRRARNTSPRNGDSSFQLLPTILALPFLEANEKQRPVLPLAAPVPLDRHDAVVRVFVVAFQCPIGRRRDHQVN